jgi:hypothetical protein
MSACGARRLFAAVLIGLAPCIDSTVATAHGGGAKDAQQQFRAAIELEAQGRYREAHSRLRAAGALVTQSDSRATRTAIAAELGWVEYRLGDFEAAARDLTAAATGGAFAAAVSTRASWITWQ